MKYLKKSEKSKDKTPERIPLSSTIDIVNISNIQFFPTPTMKASDAEHSHESYISFHEQVPLGVF